MDLFITNTQLVDYLHCLWVIVMFFGLSFWRHPFTAEDPLVNNWCNAKFLQICSDKETNYMIWVSNFFSKFSFLGELFL